MTQTEQQSIEWKREWKDDCLKWICGYANAEGGRLVIGKDDTGRVVGLKAAHKLLEDLPNKVRDVLGVIVGVNLRHAEGKDFLEIVVDAYPNPISYRGRYFMRSGSTLQELKGAALDRFILRRQGRTWDGVPVPGVKVADLSKAAIRRFRELASTSGRLAPADLRASDAGLVEKLKLRTIQGAGREPEKPKPGQESRLELRQESRLESRLESVLAAKVFLLLIQAEQGKAALARSLGHKTVSGELHKQIRRLVEKNLIERTIPNKPSSRLQKYRLTEKGRSLLEQLKKKGDQG